MSNEETPQTNKLPLIVAAVLIGAFAIIGLYVKFGKQLLTQNDTSNSNVPVSTPVIVSTPQIQTPAFTPQNTANGESNVSNNVVANSSNANATPTPIPTVETANPQKMGQQLKKEYEDYLLDKKKEIKNGITKKQQSFYEDVDNDGFEDAAFTYMLGEDQSDVFGINLVVFRNDGKQYNYVGEKNIGSDFEIVESIKVLKGRIVIVSKEYEGLEKEGQSFVRKTRTFFINNNRLQEK